MSLAKEAGHGECLLYSCGGLLENELRTDLYRTWTARAYGRIRCRDVGCGAAATERLYRRIVQAEAVLSAIRIREIRMIEDVKELGAELETIALAKSEVLR